MLRRSFSTLYFGPFLGLLWLKCLSFAITKGKLAVKLSMVAELRSLCFWVFFFASIACIDCELRSNRTRPIGNFPDASLEAPRTSRILPGSGPKPLQAEHQPRSTRGGSLHRASFRRQAQVLAEKPPLRQLAVEERTSHTKILAEQSLPEQALEGRTSQEENPPKHPPARLEQLDLEKLEHTMLRIEALQKVVRKLVRRQASTNLRGRACREANASKKATKTTTTTTTTTTIPTTITTTQPTPTTTTTTTTMSPTTTTTTSKNSQESELEQLRP